MAIYNREDPRTALPQLEKQLNARIDGLLDFFYPVGCYFETSDTEFNPNKSWGGKWELETEGLVHIGAGENYVVGATGGSKAVVLNVNQIPSHSHGYQKPVLMYGAGGNVSWGDSGTNSKGSDQWGYSGVANTGGGEAHDNMQPYIVVNRWHRVS